MVEKQWNGQRNSSLIAKAVIKNNEKFKIINELYKKHKELNKEKYVIMLKILKIYNLCFKNFSRKKIFLGYIKGKPYYASLRGIVRTIFSPISLNKSKLTEDITTSFLSKAPINIYQEIVDIGINSKILKKHMNNFQKKIFSKFFKYYRYIKEEPRVVLKIKNKTKVIELSAGFTQPYSFKVFDAVSLDTHLGLFKDEKEFDFSFTLNEAVVLTVRFSRLYLSSGINEKIFIEQTFSYLKTLLKKEIVNRQKEIKRLNIFYSKIQEQFKDYILLEKIEEKE